MRAQDAEHEASVMRAVLDTLLRTANLSAMFQLDVLEQSWVREWLTSNP